MSTSYAHLKVENKVGYIEFYNPSHNALPAAMLATLVELIEAASVDPSIAVIVLKSGGDRTFCAGASFEELIAISNPVEGAEFFEGFANVINALRNCPKITSDILFMYKKTHNNCTTSVSNGTLYCTSTASVANDRTHIFPN